MHTQLDVICHYLQQQSEVADDQRPFFLHAPLPFKVQECLCTESEPCLGMADDISKRQQFPFLFPIVNMTHALVVGKQGSGKTIFIEKFLWECARIAYRELSAIYVLDGFATKLKVLQQLDIVANVMCMKDNEYVESLFISCNMKPYGRMIQSIYCLSFMAMSNGRKAIRNWMMY